MSGEGSPQPFRDAGEGWYLRPRRRLVLRAWGVVLVLAVLVGASLASRDARAGLAVYQVVVAAALVLVLLPRRDDDRPPRTVDAPEGRGLLLPSRPASATWVLSLGALAVLVWLLPLLLAPVVDPSPGRGTPSLVAVVLAVVVCAGAGLLLALAAARGVRSRVARHDGLLLLPHGPVLRRASRVASTPWSDVRAVEARWSRPRARGDAWRVGDGPVRNWLVLERSEEAGAPGAMSLDVAELAVDPELALALARHYLADPDARDELDGGAALRRADRSEPGATGPDGG